MPIPNACEAIVKNPQLLGAVKARVASMYRKSKALMQDSSFDREDLEQELMLELCEEPPRESDEAHLLLCHNRLQDIIERLRRALRAGDGGSVVLEEYEPDQNAEDVA